jgi:flavodoxin
MNAIVIYESIYGNTRAVAEAIAAGLGDAPVMTPGELPADGVPPDLLVVGGPTHVHRMATARSRRAAIDAARPGTLQTAGRGPVVGDWLSGLPRAHGRPAAAFDTRIDKPEWLTGAASHGIAKRLRRDGYTVVDTVSFLVTETEGPLKDGELKRARRWGADLAASLPLAVADADVTP